MFYRAFCHVVISCRSAPKPVALSLILFFSVDLYKALHFNMTEQTKKKRKNKQEPFIHQPWRKIYITYRAAVVPTAVLNHIQSYQCLPLPLSFPYTACTLCIPPILFLHSSVFLILWPHCDCTLKCIQISKKKKKKKPGAVRPPGVARLSPELCYLFLPILKAWRACFQHFHTCPTRKRDAHKKEELVMKWGENKVKCV